MATDSPTPGTTDKGMQGGRPTGTRETVQARRALPLGALTSSRHLRRLEPVLREGRHISWRTKVSVVSALQQESQGLAILTAHGVSSAESRSKRVTLDPFAIAFDDNGWRGQFLRQGLESQGIYPSISFDRTRRPCIQSSTGIRCIVLRGNVTILSEKLAELRFVRRSNAEASSLEACQRRWERSSPQSREARPAESEELASDLRGGGVEGSVCSSEGCSAEESRHHAIGEGSAPQAPRAPAAASQAQPHPLKRRQLGVLRYLLGLRPSFHFRLRSLWLWCLCGAVTPEPESPASHGTHQLHVSL